MRVMLLWANRSSPNLGVRALAQGTEAIVRRAVGPEVEFICQDFGYGDLGVPVNKKLVVDEEIRRRHHLRDGLRDVDLVVDTGGGDSFTDIYGAKRMVLMSYMSKKIERAKVPRIMGPQTIGPFETRLGTMVGRWSVQQAAAVFSRDASSAARGRDLGQDEILPGTDVVFALEQERRSPGSGADDVILNVSGLLWNENPHVSHVQYRETIGRLVQFLVGIGRTVTLLPHVLSNATGDDDVEVLESVNSMPAVRDVDLKVRVPHDLADARRIIANSNLVISSRMHATLNALSQCVPAIPLSYSPKFGPLLKDIGWTRSVTLGDPEMTVAQVEGLLVRDGEGPLREEACRSRESAVARVDEMVVAMRKTIETALG